MAKRLDADFRALAEMMQTRRNEAAERVKAGEIQHFHFMDEDSIAQRMDANLDQVGKKSGPAALIALADVGVYGLALIEKPAEGA